MSKQYVMDIDEQNDIKQNDNDQEYELEQENDDNYDQKQQFDQEEEEQGEQEEEYQEQEEFQQDQEEKDKQEYQEEDIQFQPQNESADKPFQTIGDKISEEVEIKLKMLDSMVQDKSDEEKLHIRMQQLSITKLLVFTHGYPKNQLVQAHTNLGEAYLNFKCYEQAIDHLTLALKKNTKILKDEPEAKQYNINILILLGKSFLEINNYEDSFQLLKQAFELQNQFYGEESEYQVETLILMSRCLTKLNDHQTAIQLINRANSLTKDQSIIFIEMAKIYSIQEEWEQAIDNQKKAISILEEHSYPPIYQIIDLYQELGVFFEKIQDYGEQINCLQKVKQLLIEQQDTQHNKRVIKTKRLIAKILQKLDRNKEALVEHFENEQLELQVYGDDSIQLANSMRAIGILLNKENQYKDSLKYFMKSLKIYEQLKMKKIVEELKQKIKQIKENHELEISQ